MNSKAQVKEELDSAIEEFDLTRSEVGLAISGSRSFMNIMDDDTKSITTNTVDKVMRYILELRGQMAFKFDD
jgi:hypothetical protein|tara:strand:- start:738 stop:953 length:216 start_codon:yes stop_codon:yes gene_type:complete